MEMCSLYEMLIDTLDDCNGFVNEGIKFSCFHKHSRIYFIQ